MMRLRHDFCGAGLLGLPEASQGWRANHAQQLTLLRDLGYEGVVHWHGWDDIRDAGLIPCGMGRVRTPSEALELARRHRDEGLDFTTVHAGTGFESDDEMDALAEALLDASARTGYRLHLETHRATMTQDIKRTLDLLARFPDLTLTFDFSHWYTGHEMTYGDEFAERLERTAPVFAHVRSIQLRFGSTGSIQKPIDPAAPPHADHVAALDLCMRALAAMPGEDAISCAPELLPAWTPDGRFIAYGDTPETSDRFADAVALTRLAEERFQHALRARRGAIEHGP